MNLEIKKKLERAVQFVEDKGYHPVYIALFGSQNYRLDLQTEEYKSDYDFKCIVIPTLANLVQNCAPTSIVLDFEGGHIDVKDIREYMKTLRKANPAYIEPLVTEYALCVNEGNYYMPEIRGKVIDMVNEESALFINACKGLFYEKLNKMSHPYPTKIELINKFGYDGKQVCHMLRMLLTIKAFAATGQYKLIPPIEYHRQLIDLKLNKYSIEEAVKMSDGWAVELEHLCKQMESMYPKSEASFAAADEMLSYAQKMVFDFCSSNKGKGKLPEV